MRKKNIFKSLLAIGIVSAMFSCSGSNADLIVINGNIYTVDSNFTIAEAMAIKDGKILAIGTTSDISAKYSSGNIVDAEGKFIYPGFIDAHAHFTGFAGDLRQASLFGAASWSECLNRLKAFAKEKNIDKGEWILGNGWDQNLWPEKAFPDRDSLDYYFPDNPVYLSRVDGHAAIVNEAAFKAAGITSAVKLVGGEMITRNGRLTGVLIDNAMDIVAKAIPEDSEADVKASLMEAQRRLFAKGLTTIVDCGLSYQAVEKLMQLQDAGDLKLRLYAMLSDHPDNYDYILKKGKIKTDRMHVRSFKVYGDGALGSRGACLIHPYSDDKKNYGFLLSDPQHFDSVANFLYSHDLQMNTHAIGDSANRTILKVYAKYLKGTNDKRWRIEHAQVVHPDDFNYFKEYSVIPSVQPTHGTSDKIWALDRLGAERLKSAYAYKELLQQNGWVALGTDFPVEDIDPFKTFYAAVIRKDIDGLPEGGFQMENALSREETLKGITIWAAKANFEENEKGSLEPGKLADFIILDQDLLKAGENEILNIKVLATYLNGEKVYQQ